MPRLLGIKKFLSALLISFLGILRHLSSQTLHRDRLSTSEVALASISMEFSMGRGVGEEVQLAMGYLLSSSSPQAHISAITALRRAVAVKGWAHRTAWELYFQQQTGFLPDSNDPGGMAWLILMADSHWKSQISTAYACCWINSFLTASETQSCAACQQWERVNVDQKLQPVRGWRNRSSLVSPMYHRKRRQDTRVGGKSALLLMDKCWQGFLLDSMFLHWLSWLFIPPSGKICGSTALYNFKQPWIPASARVAVPHGTHLPLGNGLTWAIWKPAAYSTAVNWGFPAKAVSWSHLFMSALLTLARHRKKWGFRKKIPFPGSALFPPISVTQPVLRKRQNLFLHFPIWSGTISKSIPK